jgi:hypothetical protein
MSVHCGQTFFLFIFVKEMKNKELNMVDEKMVKLQERLDNIPMVTKRYLRIKFKKRFRKITGINLR